MCGGEVSDAKELKQITTFGRFEFLTAVDMKDIVF
jgi:hypothetical protein